MKESSFKTGSQVRITKYKKHPLVVVAGGSGRVLITRARKDGKPDRRCRQWSMPTDDLSPIEISPDHTFQSNHRA